MNDEASALFERAEAHLSTRETTKARPLLTQIETRFGDSARLQNALGILHSYENQHETAFQNFRQAMAIDPTNMDAAINLSSMLAGMGNLDGAQALLKRVAGVLTATGASEDAQRLLGYAQRLAAPPKKEGAVDLMRDYAGYGIDQVGYELSDGEWLPWIRVDGMTLYNLPIEHLDALKPDLDVGALLSLGWNQSVRDMKFRFDCTARYVAPHLNHPITPGQTIVELGAYLGHFTMFMAGQVGETGRVLAVEFIPENFRVLKRNLEANFPETCTAVHCGIWSEDGPRQAYRHMLQANSFTPHSLSGQYEPVEVPGLTVDTLLEGQGIDEVDLMVVTINGTELEAFKGMTRSLPKIKAFAIAARYGEGDENRTETVFNWLQNNGYTPTIVGGDHVYATRNPD